MDLLIFDLDGTLIDSRLDLAQAVNAARAHMGMPPLENDLVCSYVGNGAPVLIRRAIGEQASEAEVQTALEFFLQYYRDHALDHTTLYPGVRESLDRLRAAGKRMAVLTNKPVEGQPRHLERPRRGRPFLSGLRRRQFRIQEAQPHRRGNPHAGSRRGARANHDGRATAPWIFRPPATPA